MNVISSRANPLIVRTAALSQSKYRKESGIFLLEGRKLFEEAAALPQIAAQIQTVFVTEKYLEIHPLAPEKFPITVITESVLEKISTEKSPEGIVCVLKHLDFLHKRITIYDKSCEFFPRTDETVFLAADIRDPGNLGTMLRTACALGVRTVLLNESCADLYHPRTIRASMGAIFRLHIALCANFPSAITSLRQSGKEVYAAALDRAALRLGDFNPCGCCFLVGNEGHGLPQSYIEACSGTVFIPIAEHTESLNAAAAAAILLWEATRH